MKKNKKKLNLGCGEDIKKGYVNVDFFKHSGVDVVHNLNILPYPFKNNIFNEIFCSNVLEHLIYVPKVLKELHKISKPE